MKRLALSAAAAAVLALCGTAAAAPPPALDASQLAAARCGAASAPLVDVVFGLRDDYDSGFGGTWADDTILRHLRVWQVAGGYCAISADVGAFATFPGASPSGASTVSAGVRGVLDGGYRSTVFQGTFAPSAYPTRGYLGTFDLGCDVDPGCGGAHPTPAAYFSSTSGFDLAWWGWIYRAGRHGTWLNASTGSAGDVTG